MLHISEINAEKHSAARAFNNTLDSGYRFFIQRPDATFLPPVLAVTLTLRVHLAPSVG